MFLHLPLAPFVEKTPVAPTEPSWIFGVKSTSLVHSGLFLTPCVPLLLGPSCTHAARGCLPQRHGEAWSRVGEPFPSLLFEVVWLFAVSYEF